MDAQLKRGLIENCVLSALLKQDSYGYQIVKELSGRVEISESTLYPILRRLEGAGMLRVYTAEHNGRLRKYYAITPEGRRKLEQFLAEWQQAMEIYEYIRGEVMTA